MHKYEVEIKVLLTTKENRDKFKEKITHKLIDLKKVWNNSQLNHYFENWDFDKLKEKITLLIPKSKKQSFENIIDISWKHSVRTRFVDGDSILVIKLSVWSDTSANWVNRLEWEYRFTDMKIEELDKILLGSNFPYQAKWSRDREEYESRDINITIDKNAWYGYLSEFEIVVDTEKEAEKAEERIRKLLEELDVKELSQKRLARMFDFYNKNWEDYYGTEKFFNIK